MELTGLLLKTLILGYLKNEPKHPYLLIKEIQNRVDVLCSPGTIYPILDKMVTEGKLSRIEGVSPTGRKAKVYKLTPKGTEELKVNLRLIHEIIDSIGRENC